MMVRVLACTMWCLAVGCAATPGPVPTAAAEPSSVLRWAIGVTHRAPEPRHADVYLLRHPLAAALAAPAASPVATSARSPGAAPVGARPVCFSASAFLPASDGRIFYIADGRVLVGDAAGSPPRPLGGRTSGVHVTHLLAFARRAPTQLLVAGRPGAGSREVQIWILTVRNGDVTDARIATAEPALRSKRGFFDAYTTPRCLRGDADCLLLSVDHAQAYLDKEPTRDADPVELVKLGEVDVRDAAWADAASLLLLMGCPVGPA